jgi:hypothetical protein
MAAAKKAVQRTDVNILIVWLPEKLSPVYINSKKSRQLIVQGYETMQELFKKRGL